MQTLVRSALFSRTEHISYQLSRTGKSFSGFRGERSKLGPTASTSLDFGLWVRPEAKAGEDLSQLDLRRVQ